MSELRPTYTQAEFDNPKQVCDVVMKGGVTSGVVYPLAVVELAKRYRIENLGGTSAGALAAAITAAAEYGRASGGYVRVAKIPDEIASNLLSLFQPAPKLAPLFHILLAALDARGAAAKVLGMARAALAGYPVATGAGAAPGLLIGLVGLLAGASGWLACGIVLALVGALAGLIWRLQRALRIELPANGFGICPGLTQEGAKSQALTDWLADRIDQVAGLAPEGEPPGRPLTFGDLIGPDRTRPRINLAVMTTNLSRQRPYRLPFRESSYLFRRSEFEGLFPQRVVEHLVRHGRRFEAPGRHPDDFYHLPAAEELPVVVAARMSLSFPGLISAIPLYACDANFLDEAERKAPRRCWFSDGGLSSNFPIHFFDNLWPNAPTFAIALEPYEGARHGKRRVRIEQGADDFASLPIHGITGLGNFLMTLLNAAKDWQDNLQSVLPGYRERVIRIALKPDEGGLNLAMPPEVIEALTDLGREAGIEAGEAFEFDEHRWRRFLIAMARVEETLDELAGAYKDAPTDGEAFGDFLARFGERAKSYPPEAAWLAEARRRAQQLVDFAEKWRAPPRLRDGEIPRPDTDMRITSKE